MLKTTGYLISTLSVILLAIVAWESTSHEPLLRGCLVAGAGASILGMFCRWLSYEIEKKHRSSTDMRGVSAPRTLNRPVRDREMQG